MNNLSRVLVFLACPVIFSLFPIKILADSYPLVVINEIAWMGTKISDVESKNWWRYEWFELYNNTSQPILIENWTFELYRQEMDWSLPLHGTIQPNNYFLVVSSDKISPDYDLNYSNLAGKFVNSGQKLILKDNAGDIVDSVDCFTPQKWFAGDNNTKQTMERINSQAEGNNFQNWAISKNNGGTPRLINSTTFQKDEPAKIEKPTPTNIPTPTENPKATETVKEAEQIYPSNIFINEILPSPKGTDEEEEWIEIFNNNNKEINLYNWKIADTEGKTSIYTFPEATNIEPSGFLVLSRKTTGIVLNNNGDGLNLIRPNGVTAGSVSYKNAPINQSYNKTENGWAWSSFLTPNGPNVLPIAIASNDKEIIEKDNNVSTRFPDQEIPDLTSEKNLAAAGSQLPKSFSGLKTLFAAAVIASFSGVAALSLKKKTKNN